MREVKDHLTSRASAVILNTLGHASHKCAFATVYITDDSDTYVVLLAGSERLIHLLNFSLHLRVLQSLDYLLSFFIFLLVLSCSLLGLFLRSRAVVLLLGVDHLTFWL